MASKLKVFAVVAAAFALTVLASVACSQEPTKQEVRVLGVLTPEQAEPFIRAASEMSRYPLPNARPIVAIVPGESIGKLLGAFSCANPKVILVNVDTPADLRAKVLVHEFVHFLQCRAGTMPVEPTCAERAAFEAEAYIADYRFELKYLKTRHELDVTASNCENRGLPLDP